MEQPLHTSGANNTRFTVEITTITFFYGNVNKNLGGLPNFASFLGQLSII